MMGIDKSSAQLLTNHKSGAKHDHYTHLKIANLRPLWANMNYRD